MLKKILLAIVALGILSIIAVVLIIKSVQSDLPQLITVKDYQPLLVSQVYDRHNVKIGEFFRERRTLIPYDKIPKDLVNSFLAAEDDQFFQHKGINPQAIFRAALANLRAGRTVQGGSTITQQVAKTLLLTSEKTFTRKLRDILLAIEMEKNLSKEDILFLYLNQIYFGQGAYGIEQAAHTYYRKTVDKLTLPEMAILAGLPQAPSAYSPIRNPQRAKDRQNYVLRRMAEVGYITKEQSEEAMKTDVKVFVRENYEQFAPFYLETLRQVLVAQLGESTVLDKGLRIRTGLDLEKQKAAQVATEKGLKELDKRQGFRGPIKNINEDEFETFLADTEKKLILDFTPERIILPEGKFADIVPKREVDDGKEHPLLPPFLKVEDTISGVVEKVDDNLGLVYVRLPGTQGLIDFETMSWARKPNPEVAAWQDLIKKPSEALKKGDVILTRIVSEKFNADRIQTAAKRKGAANVALPDTTKFLAVELDQEPNVEAALISFDQQTQEVLAMVGGSNFSKSEFNRAIQAPRQTGSVFKALVYAAALDKGYTAATPIMDAPIVYEEGGTNDSEGQDDSKVWKPANHSKSFGGDILFRNALTRSLNIPTVKIMEDIGVPWAVDYSHRLGIYSPLNPDFTLALGSSSVTLYEMTKAFAEFGRLGKRISPLLIKSVEDANGQNLMQTLGLDARFDKETKTLTDGFEERRKAYLESLNPSAEGEEAPKKVDAKTVKIDEKIFFQDSDQLIRPSTAYIMTTLLRGVVEDNGGTGGRARALGREVAAKTGSSNNYYDGWFIGYTPQIATGVWVGFDKERSLGRGEVGGRSALPIWLDYMKAAHEGLPQMTFPVPEGIVFANIDSDTGKLASASTKNIVRQAFAEGTEPTASSNKAEEATDFYKQDLSE